MDASERYEQLIAFLVTHLPEPVDQEEREGGILVLTGGAPGEVVAKLTNSHVIIEEFSVRWGTRAPSVQPRRVGVVNWRRLPESSVMAVVGQLIKGARETRQAQYRLCRFCGTSTPPEWLAGDICGRCAAIEPGIVH